ncbi:acyl-CoA dehydrogenase family protein [Streptomyces sp. NPDC048172]|uniref:acyl-CoA dehydrogenase family protein n=1 Tax=Streptomyces sp. NPDC048172 TaxID=3365505 RepID=UPI0037238F4A
MDFRPDEDHRTYAATVRRLLDDAAPLKADRAWAAGDPEQGRALWRSLADTGLTALAVPEEADGLGWYPPELASAFLEIGRAGAPGPLVETVAVAAGLGLARAAGAGNLPWLPGLLSGELLATVADPAARHALDAHVADAAFALAGDGLCLAIPSDEPVASVDPARRLVRVTPSERVAPGAASRVRELATLLTAAQALGAGRALLDGTVAHAQVRAQFGRPIGSFQAVKHRLSTIAVALEYAEPLLFAAALRVRGDEAGTDPRDLPAAKAACCDAAYAAARAALQVHGALGYTDEYDLTLLLRKATALRSAWGTPDACRATLADASR